MGVNRVRASAAARLAAAIVMALLVCATPIACQRARPESVKYEPGRFDIDWSGYSKESRGVRDALDRNFKQDIRELVAEMGKPHVQNALRSANNRPPPRNDFEILKLEEQWRRSSATSSFITERIDHYCSLELNAFMRENPEFVEIFVTNKSGFNVCQTNKTTDYYQADEEWWQTTMSENKPSHGKLTYDQSADTMAVPIYVPVLNRQGAGTLGVAKAVIRRDTTTVD